MRLIINCLLDNLKRRVNIKLQKRAPFDQRGGGGGGGGGGLYAPNDHPWLYIYI